MRLLITLPTLALAAACTRGATLGPGGQSAELPPIAKIDTLVRAAMDTSRELSVILLGRTQLLERRQGLERFAARNDRVDRRTSRAQVIASLKRIAAPEQQRVLAALGKAHADHSLWITNALVLSLTPDEIRRAAALHDVEFIYPSFEQFPEPEKVGTLSEVLPPVRRKAFSTEGKRIGWNVERLGAPKVWSELDDRGEGTIVAIVDNGVNYAQHNLRDNIWRNTREVPGNGVDDDHNGYIDDYYGYNFSILRAEVRDTSSKIQHGTWTSGIVAGDGTDGIITGVAPRTTLMELISGFGPVATALSFQYALENGADVISMSFSLGNQGNLRGLWRMMCDNAVAAGAVLVGGAGNFQQSAKIPYQIIIPKDIPSVIAVGGVDTAFAVVPFSSLGPVEWGTVALYGDHPMPPGLTKPDVMAFPGPNYPVLALADSGYIDPNLRIQGNSFSGPQGAGVAALMFSVAPGLQAWKVKAIIEQTARDLETPGKDNRTGFGLIDAYRAVLEARKACASAQCARRTTTTANDR